MTRLVQTIATLTDRRRKAAEPSNAVPARMMPCTVSSNPGALKMWVHVPVGLGTGAPLVVVLHGCTQGGEAYAKGAGWLTLADRFGFVVLCPEQTTANNPNRCFNWFQPGDTARGGGEAASIAAMTRQVVADHAIDPDRVFVTGLSAGGAMTGVMLATYPEMFRAGAIIAGLPYGAATTMSEALGAMMQPKALDASAWGDKVRSASAHAGPWPSISIWHGDADATVRSASADALVQQWTHVHGVSASRPSRARTPAGRVFDVWLSPSGTPVVESHRIAGLAHGTPLNTQGPTGVGEAGPFLLDVGISSSFEIALSWGIVENRDVEPGRGPAGKAYDAASEPAARTSGRPSTSATIEPLAPREQSVSEIIETALKAAGLMR